MSEYQSIRTEVLALLKTVLPDLQEKFGVKEIGLFGSVSRGEDTPESDVDVMVTFTPGNLHIRNFMGVSASLEEIFGRKVDLVTPTGISPYMLPYIHEEMIWCATI